MAKGSKQAAAVARPVGDSSGFIHEVVMACVMADVVPYLQGVPGCGKTALCRSLAKTLEVSHYHCLLAQKAGNEIHGIPLKDDPMIIDGQEVPVIKHAPPKVVVEMLLDKRGGICNLDEINHLSPPDLGQVMSILSDRVWAEIYLPRERISFIACGNPPEMSAGGWRIPLPVRRRLCVLDVTPDVGMFTGPQGLSNGFHGAEALFGHLGNTGKLEEPEVDPILPPLVKHGRTLNQEERYRKRTMLAAWVHGKPDLFVLPKDITTMYAGYPSFAGIETAADALVSVEQYVRKETQGVVRQAITYGLLGPGAGGDLLTYLDNLDVPDSRVVLDDPTAFIKSGTCPESEKAYYFFMSLVEESRFRTRAAASSSSKKLLERAQKSWCHAIDVAAYVKDKAPRDMVCMLVGNLQLPDVKPKNVVPPPSVDKLGDLLGLMKAAGINWVRMASMRSEEAN